MQRITKKKRLSEALAQTQIYYPTSFLASTVEIEIGKKKKKKKRRKKSCKDKSQFQFYEYFSICLWKTAEWSLLYQDLLFDAIQWLEVEETFLIQDT